MDVEQFSQYVSWLTYLLIFARTVVQAVRRPRRANIDIALLFSATTIIIALSVASRLRLLADPPFLTTVSTAVTILLLLALPYLLLRLVDDFSNVPAWLMRASEVALALMVVTVVVLEAKLPLWLLSAMLLYMVGFLVYSTVAFWRESRRSTGVTRRRLAAVAWGSIFLCAIFLLVILSIALPAYALAWRLLSDVASLASGISYFIGFAPPLFLRRAWQEPELRAFLGRAASLPRLPDTNSILRELERGTRSSVGAPHASIGLWNEERQVLHFGTQPTAMDIVPNHNSIAGRAFLTQRPALTDNIEIDNPTGARLALQYGARALLAAPITAGDRRLGVLVAYAPRAPIFADEDLELVKLLADQAAVVLESRALIDEAARVQAREEVARLKEDFLSAAAHDLKTPLTVLVAQAQFMERRVTRNPELPADPKSIQRIVQETQRLRELVLELLDASRAEQGMLVGEREEVDLVALAEQVCARRATERHPCTVEAEGRVVGHYDEVRITQLIENLVENAVKYSPEGGAVLVKAWREAEGNCLSVADEGIGIPSADIPRLFERFHRGTNVNDRKFSGMGLGLFICRGIAEQHGGRIWATSEPGKGSTFQVMLPVNPTANAPATGNQTSNNSALEPSAERDTATDTNSGSQTPLVLAEGGKNAASRPNPGH
ncbi:MAG TPA: ATP-binding protein [Chloroflexia bacterium]|jgi:signal transduction histidine kinase|nr:ATP-binding protein [Chloroflexia bacterium]